MDLVFKAQLLSGEHCDCPHCGRYAQVYKRHIHATIARQMIMLFEQGGHSGKYIHAANLIPDGQSGAGDLSKAKYFGLIQAMPENNEAKKSSGYWTLTDAGLQFVKGKLDIPEYALVFDDKVVGVSQDKIFISDALKSGGFHYNDLIQGTITE